MASLKERITNLEKLKPIVYKTREKIDGLKLRVKALLAIGIFLVLTIITETIIIIRLILTGSIL